MSRIRVSIQKGCEGITICSHKLLITTFWIICSKNLPWWAEIKVKSWFQHLVHGIHQIKTKIWRLMTRIRLILASWAIPLSMTMLTIEGGTTCKIYRKNNNTKQKSIDSRETTCLNNRRRITLRLRFSRNAFRTTLRRRRKKQGNWYRTFRKRGTA